MSRAETVSSDEQASARPGRTLRRTRQLNAFEVQILAVAVAEEQVPAALAHLDAALMTFDATFQQLHEPDVMSAIARVEAGAGKTPVRVDALLFAAVREATHIASVTNGAFDPTRVALAELWRPAPAEQTSGAPPRDEVVQEALSRGDYRDLLLDESDRSVGLAREGQRLSVRRVAKGVALDHAARTLESAGVSAFMIIAGGDIVVRGDHAERPWRVGIQDPRAAGYFAALDMPYSSVMTTGDYENFVFHDGKRYFDVVDPRSGQMARGIRSVSVFCDDAAFADGLSVALFALGATEGLALVERLRGVEALMVTEENAVRFSSGLGHLMYRPPTDAP